MTPELSDYLTEMAMKNGHGNAPALATDRQWRLKVIAAKEALEDFDRLTENGRQKAAAHARIEVKRSHLCAKIAGYASLALSLNEWTPPPGDYTDMKLDAFDHLVMGIFGLGENIQVVRLQAQVALLTNPSTQHLSIYDVMRGKTQTNSPVAPTPNPNNPFGPQPHA